MLTILSPRALSHVIQITSGISEQDETDSDEEDQEVGIQLQADCWPCVWLCGWHPRHCEIESILHGINTLCLIHNTLVIEGH